MFHSVEAVLKRRVGRLKSLHVFRGWPDAEYNFFAYWMKEVKFGPVRRCVVGMVLQGSIPVVTSPVPLVVFLLCRRARGCTTQVTRSGMCTSCPRAW